jgi:hypothetical protein
MPRKKKRLDALTRERFNRIIKHHPHRLPPLSVPDPSDIGLRRWVIRLTEDALHQEVCRRLAERWTLIRDALMAWPYDYLGDKKARFPTLVQFLERITIDSPVLESESREDRFPTLGFRSLPPMRRDPIDPRRLHTDDGPPDPIEVACIAFEKKVFEEWIFRPSSYEGRSPDEYDRLVRALREVKTQARWRNAIRDLLAKGPTVDLAGQEYQVPRDWRRRLSVTAPPSEVARLLLSLQWGRDPQAVKELLVGLRKYVPIAAAWAAYDEWLHQESIRVKDIHLLICRRPVVLAWPRTWPTVDGGPSAANNSPPTTP